MFFDFLIFPSKKVAVVIPSYCVLSSLEQFKQDVVAALPGVLAVRVWI